MLWVRIYDIPATMMTDGFARVLGGKIGKVVEVGDVHNNYKRVRIDFLLEKALVPSVQQRVKGHGTMAFIVRYENVPFFCFTCGRIGHAQRECPDGDDEEGTVHFGQVLRCSPQKKDVGRRMIIPTEPNAKHGLNFSGEQRRRVLSEANSSNAPSRRVFRGTNEGRDREPMRGAGGLGMEEKDDQSHGELPKEVSVDLATGVANMAVNPQAAGG
jgi:hypothetical protein